MDRADHQPVSDPPYAAQQNTRGIMPRVSATAPYFALNSFQ